MEYIGVGRLIEMTVVRSSRLNNILVGAICGSILGGLVGRTRNPLELAENALVR